METLPHKWHIIPRNEEQDKIFSNWRGGKHDGEMYEVALTSDKSWKWLRNIDSDSVELNLYQFKLLVLKKYLPNGLPEKWYIVGCTSLREYLKTQPRGITDGWAGGNNGTGYFINTIGKWVGFNLYGSSLKNYTRITFDDFIRLSNINREEQTTNQTIQNSEAMNTTTQPKKERIITLINKDNEIETIQGKLKTTKVRIAKETITTRVVKLQSVSFDRKDKVKETPIVTTVEREVSISVIADEKGDIYTGYSVKNPTDKNVSDEIGKTIARNRAVNPKTNLTLGEGVTAMFISKQVLKGIADLFFAKMSQGSVQLKGVK